MSDDKAEQEKIVKQIYEYAASLKMKGKKAAEIKQELMDKGMEAETADIVVNNIERQYGDVKKQQGKKNMIYGALWCVGGTIITIVTLSMARGGSYYIITWGAIVFGAIQFFKGLAQYLSK